MNIQKAVQTFLALALAVLVGACQPQSGSPSGGAATPTLPAPQIVVQTAVPATLPPTETAAKGRIQGTIYLMAPPTPPMVVYAVETTNGSWVSTQTQQTDGEAPYTLEVPSGNYQVFAAVTNGKAVDVGHFDATGTKLDAITVKAGQTVANIVVMPPSQNECGAMAGLPASPDGRFAATTGPAAGCSATQTAEAASSGGTASEAVRIQFPANTTRSSSPGDLAPQATRRFVLGAQKGQQMTVQLTTEPASGPTPLADLAITGADGKALTTNPTLYWSGVLTASQDYFIEVHSLSKQPILYTLSIEIPAAVIDPANGNMYEVPDLSVCQTFQTIAAQALGVTTTLQVRAPFLDTLGGEAGQGCRLIAGGTGKQFNNPQAIVDTLVSQMGFTELPNYRADGPTGSAAGAIRDMGLMLISATWAPAMGVVCPSDKPISECNLTPEQKVYTIEVDAAYYKASFTLSGHWEDAKTGLSLDLVQTWKDVSGHHLIAAQGGNKIDTLDGTTITGTVQAKVATVQFQSSFASDLGTAQITLVDTNTIQWKVTAPPSGEYYLPAEATLTRK